MAARARPCRANNYGRRPYHLEQWDVIFFVQGLAEMILRDVRAQQRKPGFMERGVLAAAKNLDTDLTPAQLYRLAQAVTGIQPGKLKGCVVQGGTGPVGGAGSVVFADIGQARRIGNDARKDGTLDHGC